MCDVVSKEKAAPQWIPRPDGVLHYGENREGKDLVPVTLQDFNAGHYPGLKSPPLCLNEIFRGNHPELIAKADEAYLDLKPGEQSPVIFSIELTLNGEREIIDQEEFFHHG
ncbi:MAG: hypothetical protein A3D65_06275 [Candidatus Lloydbacteria bacterium RIFCSPHIGHO2_02_FULL_50_13]|uniref:Uncharacterized protein n=1 Tax=Candidatus Lloydbacteria bacterium RIFCSPHIGHO2_02_FULL_50_13 TaxID=1798661 RepID=A0A1G2D3E0_9BACT|nr:MAG: hypothetical protein A3D65_06275 [Candidatus Lloydbacteria bacterium RIFCSPHIGHO2_02_FULL_50_13]